MGYIHTIRLEDNSYHLIEPQLFAVAGGTGSALTASIANFELIPGAYIFLQAINNNNVNATLTINNTTAPIYYDSGPVNANVIKRDRIYTLLYDGDYWQIVNDIESNNQLAYGNLQTDGTLQTNDVTIDDGDKLVITDTSDSNKIARASVRFDGYTETKALTQKGTWEDFNNYVHPTTSGNKHIPSGGAEGQILGWDSDGTAAWVSLSNNTAVVSQESTSDNYEFNILLKYTHDEVDETAGTHYASDITVNPYTGMISADLFTGSGENLTNLNASRINAGEIGLAYLPTIPNSQLENSSITIANNTISLGGTLSADTLVSSLGLSNAMHFIGQATVAFTDNTFPNIQNYTPAEGDVVIDENALREYVWDGSEWILLGFTTSTIQDSNGITATIANVPTWISRVTQATDGRITIERNTLGILPVSHGGTGADSFARNQVILSDDTVNDTTFISRAYSDSQIANALTSTSNYFVTERHIYNGLPFINNSHSYTSANTIYAPIGAGTEYALLTAIGSNTAPVWSTNAKLIDEASETLNDAAYSHLILGNSDSVLTTDSHSEGKITLYSNDTNAHIIMGTSTAVDYTHLLPNASGTIIQAPNANAVGGPTQPIYIAANGVATALTFTANRLYHSSSTTSFSATGHYADTTTITVNGTSAPDNNTTFQVIGTSTLQHIVPQTNTTYDIGSDDTRWRSSYLTTSLLVGAAETINDYDDDELGTFIGPSVVSTCVDMAGDYGYYLMGEGQQYSRLYIDHLGIANIDGTAILELGNELDSSVAKNARGILCLYSASSSYADITANGWISGVDSNDCGTIESFTFLGQTSKTIDIQAWTTIIIGNDGALHSANAHSQGRIRLYSETNTYTDIQSQGGYNKILYLPAYNGDMYVTHVSSNDAVGSGTVPVYVASNGRITVSSSTVGDSYAPVYLNGGETTVTFPVQYKDFTIASGATSVTLESPAYNRQISGMDVFVLSIVIVTGESFLNAPIQWRTQQKTGSTTIGQVILSTPIATSGAVTGYILTARGTEAPAAPSD